MSQADFPHAQPVEAAGGVLRNDFYGITISPMPAANGRGTDFEISRVGDLEAHTATDLASAQTAYAKLWMESVAVGVGLGFHPDTPADAYEPALEADLAAQYDEMIGFCHDHLEDPYAVGYEAWEKAGLIEATPAP